MQRVLIGTIAVGMALGLGLGCGGATSSCPETETVGLFCDFKAPEDLEVLPGASRVLVSEYGGLAGKRPGTITALHLESDERQVLYPLPADEEPDALWGDPACTEPIGAVFAPHGIHLTKGPDGGDRVLAVNHASRESVEIFELSGAASDTPSLRWRGCVVAPDHVWLNDVAGLPDGGFIASHMMKRGTAVDDLLHRADGEEPPMGHAVEWTPAGGWRMIEGTEGVVTNGVQTSPDGAVAYVVFTLSDKAIAVERATGKRLWETEVEHPDNISWAPDGRLLVASIRADLEAVLKCVESDAPFCPIDFGVVAIDPATGEATTVAEGGGPPFGLATVAVQVGPKYYLGSATGERIGIVSGN